jgi:hypothetical protein
MKRRALLATLGTATALTAGCLNRQSGGTPTEEPPRDGSLTDSPTTDDGTETPDDPATPEAPLADVECPSFADGVDRTVCWPNGDTDGETLYVDASSVVFEPDTGDDEVETIEFVLHNASEESFGLNPYAWSLRRKTADGWSFVAPGAHVEPWHTVESGGTYAWQLSVEKHPSPSDENAMVLVQDLADGVYAFQVTGAFGDGPSGGTQVECVALFEVRRGR